MGFRTPNFQQFQQPQQQKQFQEQDQDLQPVGKRQRGTGFTNIGRILGANVGAGERMGRQVGQTIGAKAGQAQAGVTQAQEQFQKKKEQGEAEATSAIQKVSKNLGDISSLASMSEEDARKAGEEFATKSQYTGPKGLEQSQQLKAKAESLGNVATMGMSGLGGQQQLARSMIAAPGAYTRGQSVLDTALLGQSSIARQAIEEGARQALGVQQNIERSIGSTQQQAQASQLALEKLKADTEKTLREKLGTIEKTGEEAYKTYAKEGSSVQKLLSDVAAGKIKDYSDLTKEQLSALENLDKYGLSDVIGYNEIVGPTGQVINKTPYSASGLTKTELADVLNTLATGYSQKAGASQFSEEQKNALKNLALLRSDKELAEKYEKYEDPGKLFSQLSGKEALRKTKEYTDEAYKKYSDATQAGYIGGQIGLIRDIKKLSNNDWIAAGKRVGLDLQRDAGKGPIPTDTKIRIQNEITDRLIRQLPPQIQQEVRQFQAGPNRTVGQVADLLQGYLGQGQEIAQRLAKGQQQPASLKNLILSQLAGVPTN
jgi:hypothetical protein